MCTGGAHQEARRAGDATKPPESEAPKFVGLSTVAATSRPNCRNGNFDEDGGSVHYLCESAAPTSVVPSTASVPGARCPYDSPTICADPNACRSYSAFAIDGSMEELVDGRIPRHGNVEIRNCKPAAAGAGPSNPPNRGTDNFSPKSGGTIPYDEDDVSKRDRKDPKG